MLGEILRENATDGMHNVEVNRSKEGAAPAPQGPCLTKESVPTIG